MNAHHTHPCCLRCGQPFNQTHPAQSCCSRCSSLWVNFAMENRGIDRQMRWLRGIRSTLLILIILLVLRLLLSL